MGRGRAKAKQTKVARELKYSSQHTDFAGLQRELASPHTNGGREGDSHVPSGWDEEDDDWQPGR